MSYFLDVNEEWNQINPKDIWAYNKLSLSRVLAKIRLLYCPTMH
jgi:hypothetical protein